MMTAAATIFEHEVLRYVNNNQWFSHVYGLDTKCYNMLIF